MRTTAGSRRAARRALAGIAEEVGHRGLVVAIEVDDLEATLAKIEALGGRAVGRPFDLGVLDGGFPRFGSADTARYSDRRARAKRGQVLAPAKARKP